MKKYLDYLLITFLVGFGLLNLFLSTSVIFDLFDIRAKEGNYVLIVVWANFVSSLIYLTAAYGYSKKKEWTTLILSISIIILMITLLGLIIHINSGGIYEMKTIKAMVFRVSVTFVITLISYIKITKIANIKRFSTLFLVIGLFFTSCGNNSNKESNKPTESTSHIDHQNHDGDKHHDDKNDQSQTIELNNGEKWKVNAEMTPFILEGKEILAKYDNIDYKTLAKQLKEKNSGLIKSCTMDGKSHDELHKWLHPHMELIESLEKAENEQSANTVIEQLKKSFKTYSNYFQ